MTISSVRFSLYILTLSQQVNLQGLGAKIKFHNPRNAVGSVRSIHQLNATRPQSLTQCSATVCELMSHCIAA